MIHIFRKFLQKFTSIKFLRILVNFYIFRKTPTNGFIRTVNNKIIHIISNYLFKKDIVLFHGGLGDYFLLIPYLKILKKNSNRKLKVIVKDEKNKYNPNSKSFSYDTIRYQKDKTNNLINPLKEFMQCFHFIDEIEGGKLNEMFCEYWFPYDFTKNQMTPSVYRALIFPDLFNNKNLKNLSNFIDFKKKNIICIHFRRNANFLKILYDLIKKKYKDKFQYVILGSTEHEEIPDHDLNDISFVDSYSKGISLIEILYTIANCNLFLGGRGGFEIFAWYSGIPTVNILDEKGIYYEVPYGFYPNMWLENKINRLFSLKDTPEYIFKIYIIEILDKILES